MGATLTNTSRLPSTGRSCVALTATAYAQGQATASQQQATPAAHCSAHQAAGSHADVQLPNTIDVDVVRLARPKPTRSDAPGVRAPPALLPLAIGGHLANPSVTLGDAARPATPCDSQHEDSELAELAELVDLPSSVGEVLATDGSAPAGPALPAAPTAGATSPYLRLPTSHRRNAQREMSEAQAHRGLGV